MISATGANDHRRPPAVLFDLRAVVRDIRAKPGCLRAIQYVNSCFPINHTLSPHSAVRRCIKVQRCSLAISADVFEYLIDRFAVDIPEVYSEDPGEGGRLVNQPPAAQDRPCADMRPERDQRRLRAFVRMMAMRGMAEAVIGDVLVPDDRARPFVGNGRVPVAFDYEGELARKAFFALPSSAVYTRLMPYMPSSHMNLSSL